MGGSPPLPPSRENSDSCTCNKTKCLATGLKQCSACKKVLCSICNKISCRVDGTEPTMILPATAKLTIFKRLSDSGSDESDKIHKVNSKNKDETTKKMKKILMMR